MALLRRFVAALLGMTVFLGGTASALAAAVCLPGRAWLVRGAVLWQDPAAGAALTWPVQETAAQPSAAQPETTPLPAPTPPPAAQQGAEETPAATPAPTATPLPSAAPEIEDPGAIRAEHFGQGSGDGYIELEAGTVRNLTDHSDADLRAAI